jgi:hypothetical protein
MALPLIVLAIVSSAIFISRPLYGQDVTIMVTSNLEGRFSLNEKNDPEDDPLLVILQSIYRERAGKNPVVFLDLGNGFCPGILSRYSFGSVIHDFFSLNQCDATLVSSRDLRIGIDSLLRSEDEGRKILLSSNIMDKNKNLFQPRIMKTVAGKKIAVIGLSSEHLLFDIIDKNLTEVKIDSYLKTVEKTIAGFLSGQNPDCIIAVSGLNAEKNLAVMKKFPMINLMISGGDSQGELYGVSAAQVILPDNRRILLTEGKKSLYKIEGTLKSGFDLKSFSHVSPARSQVKDDNYARFVKRLGIWKNRYREEDKSPFDSNKNFSVNVSDRLAADMMRDRYRTEVSIMAADSVTKFVLTKGSSAAGIMDYFNDDYYIYQYKLSGGQLKTLVDNQAFSVIGIEKGTIQRNRIENDTLYSVSSTQLVYERITSDFENPVAFSNKWVSIPELLIDDVQKNGNSLSNDYSHLGNRFRTLVGINLSNMYNSEKVRSGSDISSPSGQAELSNTQWGFENSVNLIVYNQYHTFILTPYMNYVEQDLPDQKVYLKNILRGTFVYKLNVDEIFQPYHKSLCETVFRKVDPERPISVRETVGIDVTGKYVTSKLGFGFEKRMHSDPSGTVYGIELSAQAELPVYGAFAYIGAFDSFWSKGVSKADNFYRAELTNGLSYRFTKLLKASVKHDYYYYYESKINQKYTRNAISLSLDLNTDFKM